MPPGAWLDPPTRALPGHQNRRLVLVSFLLLVVVSARAWGALPPAAQAGREAMARAECNRCHTVTDLDLSDGNDGLAALPREKSCTGCHTWILGTRGDEAEIARQRADFPDWDRYLDTVRHLVTVPDLGTLTRRVRPSFVRSWLDAPYDLRPHLEESMVPVRLSSTEKDAVVAYLAALSGRPTAPQPSPPSSAPDAARVAAGRAAFAQAGCVACHVVGAEPVVPGLSAATYAQIGDAGRLAPDLALAPARLDRETFERFVLDPQALDPQTQMPKLAVTPAQVAQIADFIYGGAHVREVEGPAPVAVPEVALLDRPVRWDEVKDEVFGRICVHCHMNPETNGGDGGPGHSGGLGFAGKRLDLETLEGLKRGAVVNGRRVSVLRPGPDGTPPLLAALLRRHVEASRDARGPYVDVPMGPGPDPAAPGMPLGLPPLDLERLRLVKTWIAQGARR